MTRIPDPQRDARLRNDVDDLYVLIGRVQVDLADLRTVVDGHTVTLDGHTQTLDGHTKTLDGHTQILDKHTQVLTEHSRTLDDHGRKLDRIIEILESPKA